VFYVTNIIVFECNAGLISSNKPLIPTLKYGIPWTDETCRLGTFRMVMHMVALCCG